MTAVHSVLRPALVRVLLALAMAVSVGGFADLASAPSATAAFSPASGEKVVEVAATRKGAAYREWRGALLLIPYSSSVGISIDHLAEAAVRGGVPPGIGPSRRTIAADPVRGAL